jgi:WD40 repeat protein
VRRWDDRWQTARDLSHELKSGNFLGSMALSPDGTQVAVSLLNSDGMSSDLWDLDLTRGTKIRLTSGPGMKRNPVWQPDGQLLFSAGFTGGSIRIDRIKSDGTGTSETVLKSDDFVDALRQFVAKAIICLLPDPRTFRAAQPLKGQQLGYSPLLETGSPSP